MEQLQSAPLLSAATKAFMNLGMERLEHGLSMAEKIRLGPNQLPRLYKLLPPICAKLGVPEPNFYLEMDPAPNAFAFGDTITSVTVTSGLLDMLEEDELAAIVAHEVGHIACRHMLYRTMTMLLMRGGSGVFGSALSLVSKPLAYALFYWFRRSEFSADRAAAFAMGGAQPVVDTMIRLSGGGKSLTAEVDVGEYVRQVEEYERFASDTWERLLLNANTMTRSHPLNAVRAREVIRWCEGDEFRRLLAAGSVAALAGGPGTCGTCGKPAAAEWRFCMHCGIKLPAAAPAAAATA